MSDRHSFYLGKMQDIPLVLTVGTPDIAKAEDLFKGIQRSLSEKATEALMVAGARRAHKVLGDWLEDVEKKLADKENEA